MNYLSSLRIIKYTTRAPFKETVNTRPQKKDAKDNSRGESFQARTIKLVQNTNQTLYFIIDFLLNLIIKPLKQHYLMSVNSIKYTFSKLIKMTTITNSVHVHVHLVKALMGITFYA